MKTKILFIERRFHKGVSIEKVFRQIAKSLSRETFEFSFQQLPFLNNTLGTIKNLLFFKKKEKSDIYHVTGHVHYISLILPKKNTVLTVHDLGILRIRTGLRRYILKKILLDLPVKKLKYITTISEETKKEIIFYTKCDEKKIRVIENPLQENLYLLEEKTFNKQNPLILQIGTTYNKNLKNLIKALKNIKCRLRIIGEIDAETKILLKQNQVDFTTAKELNDLEIRNEYQKADIVAFCSTFEGFGLPIIEAQAMQTPVITSDLSPMKEVSGDAAMLVNPTDYFDIKKGIEKIIDDDELRKSLVEKGLENIKRFNAAYIAGLYEELYEEITNSKTERF